MNVETADYHTAGEPFRIVLSGVPEIAGDTVRERREKAAADPRAQAVRALLCHEPRGHADMYGGFIVPPDDPGARFGVLFWHKDGFSTACGHGTIALGAWAVESGLVEAPRDGVVPVVIDVPSGRVTARVLLREGRVETVTFRNVPSYPLARAVPVTTSFGETTADLSYGGAIYASVRACGLGLRVAPECLTGLIAAGREVKAALAGTPAAEHPADPRLSGIYGTILYDELPDTPEGPHQRNVTVFADGQVDRSPCGSGTSARLALLGGTGVLTHDSLVGTAFRARVVEETEEVIAGRALPAVVTEVEGTAFRTGRHEFVLDPRDPLGTGFVLR